MKISSFKNFINYLVKFIFIDEYMDRQRKKRIKKFSKYKVNLKNIKELKELSKKHKIRFSLLNNQLINFQVLEDKFDFIKYFLMFGYFFGLIIVGKLFYHLQNNLFKFDSLEFLEGDEIGVFIIASACGFFLIAKIFLFLYRINNPILAEIDKAYRRMNKLYSFTFIIILIFLPVYIYFLLREGASISFVIKLCVFICIIQSVLIHIFIIGFIFLTVWISLYILGRMQLPYLEGALFGDTANIIIILKKKMDKVFYDKNYKIQIIKNINRISSYLKKIPHLYRHKIDNASYQWFKNKMGNLALYIQSRQQDIILPKPQSLEKLINLMIKLETSIISNDYNLIEIPEKELEDLKSQELTEKKLPELILRWAKIILIAIFPVLIYLFAKHILIIDIPENWKNSLKISYLGWLVATIAIGTGLKANRLEKLIEELLRRKR